MKKLLLTLCLFLGTYNLFAQNILTIFSEDGLPFYLILNGIRQNENPETNVRVNGLTADYYSAKIIFNDATIGEIEKKFLMTTGAECKPCDVTYKIKYDKKGLIDMKPFAFSQLSSAPPPPNVTVVNYNTVPMPAPVIGVQVTETTTTITNGSSENVNMGINLGGFNMGVNVNVNDGFGSSSSSQTTTTTTTTLVPAQPVIVEEVGCRPMSDTNFNAFLNSVTSKTWDDSRLTVAKQATSANCLTALQIKRVMSAFQWEDSRLDYAKFAYSYCFDQQNYYQINDAFEWEDSIDDLSKYIGR